MEKCVECNKVIDLDHDLFVGGNDGVYFCYYCSHTGSDER